MSQEKVLKTLENLGLTQQDAKIYIFLSKKGPQKAKTMFSSMKIPKQTLYRTLQILQKKGMITSTFEHPARFSAVPFEKVLDLLIKTKMEEAQRVQQNRNSILSDWQSINIQDSDETSAKFTVIQGRNTIFSRIQQMIQESTKQLSFITTVPSLIRADQHGLLETAYKNPKKQIQYKFIIDLSNKNLQEIYNLFQKTHLNFECRIFDLEQKNLPRMVIKDEVEVLFFVDPQTDVHQTEKDVCLWTNCQSIAKSFSTMFENFWINSKDVQKKILEMKNGAQTPKTLIINEPKVALEKYQATLQGAKKEVIIVTSSEHLSNFTKYKKIINHLNGSGVIIKIMAPITQENVDSAKQLAEICQLRHVPEVYFETTTIDSQHFFQYKQSSPNQANRKLNNQFENVFYTNDTTQIKRIEKMLNEFWKNAIPTSNTTIQSILSSQIAANSALETTSRYKEYRKIPGWIEENEEYTLTEKDILDKILNAKKTHLKNILKDKGTAYCSSGLAVIHPPPSFKLPDMIIVARHFYKQSALGPEDMIGVYLSHETPSGPSYQRAATAGDNPTATKMRKQMFSGTPAEYYCHLLKKHQIQVRLHGNTLLASWTVNIPLFPSPYTLPPACILFKGYGKLKTGMVKTQSPLGRTEIAEFNGFDAFVTFFHPASKYSGPGTDGLLRRDLVLTTYPPTQNNSAKTPNGQNQNVLPIH